RLKRFIIANTGPAGTTLSGNVIQPSSPFVIQNGCTSFSLPGGASCSLDVAYSPTSSAHDTGAIEILSNASDNPSTSVSLTGQGGCDANFNVSGLIVPRHQPSPSSCWATAGAVMVTWRTGTIQDEISVANLADSAPPATTVYLDRLHDLPWHQGLLGAGETVNFLN